MGSVSSIAELRSDPERLLNGAGGRAELEQVLLGSLRTVPVPVGAKALVWDALGVQVVGTTAAAASSSWGHAFWRSALKTLAASKAAVAVPVVVASLGVGAAGAAGALHYDRSSADSAVSLSATRTLRVQTPSTGAVASASSSVEPASTEDSDLSAPEAPARVAPSWPARDPLREESALLARARTQLRSGNARAAQVTLFRMQTKFPKGALSQEREVLVIEALAARGNSAAAERNARTFIAEHPESPHAVQLLRRFME